jgi:hypothetical protein
MVYQVGLQISHHRHNGSLRHYQCKKGYIHQVQLYVEQFPTTLFYTVGKYFS